MVYLETQVACGNVQMIVMGLGSAMCYDRVSVLEQITTVNDTDQLGVYAFFERLTQLLRLFAEAFPRPSSVSAMSRSTIRLERALPRRGRTSQDVRGVHRWGA